MDGCPQGRRNTESLQRFLVLALALKDSPNAEGPHFPAGYEQAGWQSEHFFMRISFFLSRSIARAHVASDLSVTIIMLIDQSNVTLRETNIAPENRLPKKNVVSQPWIFRDYVSFQGGCYSYEDDLPYQTVISPAASAEGHSPVERPEIAICFVDFSRRHCKEKLFEQEALVEVQYWTSWWPKKDAVHFVLPCLRWVWFAGANLQNQRVTTRPNDARQRLN